MTVALENCKKSPLKRVTEKPVLPNFENLSTICLRLLEFLSLLKYFFMDKTSGRGLCQRLGQHNVKVLKKSYRFWGLANVLIKADG